MDKRQVNENSDTYTFHPYNELKKIAPRPIR